MTEEEFNAHAKEYPWDAPLVNAEIQNPVYVVQQEEWDGDRSEFINCDVEHPVLGWIPISLNQTEYPLTYARAKAMIEE